MKRIALLGSTGSIGTNTLQVVDALPERFEIVALAAGGRDIERLAGQIKRYRPRAVAVADAARARTLQAHVPRETEILYGPDGLVAVATLSDCDLVVSALVGAVGLRPTQAALEAGRDVALANKEALVVAGHHMTAAAARCGARILPVDSEHNAVHQCLRGERIEDVRRIWLTASGGPFLALGDEALARVTPEQALQHPTWKMGPKITVDSATLMNKGLEVIEARWLFGLPATRIRVVIHPQSVVHSMVEFIDGSFKAQLGITDMRHPIQYALTWPERCATALPPFDPPTAGTLAFDAPDTKRFPCLALAYRALEAGGAAPAVLNAANEVAVAAFLDGRATFAAIPAAIEAALDDHAQAAAATLDDLLAADGLARRSTAAWLVRGAAR